jgi:hypothetical protein
MPSLTTSPHTDQRVGSLSIVLYVVSRPAWSQPRGERRDAKLQSKGHRMAASGTKADLRPYTAPHGTTMNLRLAAASTTGL